MVPCAAAMASSAPNRQFVTSCEVSTLPGNAGGGKFRRQQRSFWNDDPDRAKATAIHRNVVVDHYAEHVEHGGARHRLGRIEVAGLLRARAGEIDGRLAAILVHRDA